MVGKGRDANDANPSPDTGVVGTGEDILIEGSGFDLVRRVLCVPTFSMALDLEVFFALVTGLLLLSSCLILSNDYKFYI